MTNFTETVGRNGMVVWYQTKATPMSLLQGRDHEVGDFTLLC